MPGRRKPGPLEHVDEARQLPERHGLRGGKAILNVLDRQVGLEPVMVMMRGRLRVVAHGDGGVVDQPIALVEACLLGVDAADEAILALEQVHGHIE